MQLTEDRTPRPFQNNPGISQAKKSFQYTVKKKRAGEREKEIWSGERFQVLQGLGGAKPSHNSLCRVRPCILADRGAPTDHRRFYLENRDPG